MPITKLERISGCLLGGAIGDALGAPIEFYSIYDIRQEYGSAGITGYVEFPDNTGEFTDDTQMTLFTAEGLLRAHHRAVMRGIGGAMYVCTQRAYLRWLKTQGYSVNLSTLDKNSVDFLDDHLNSGWLIKKRELFISRAPGSTCINAVRSGILGTIEKPINNSKGCGGIMRVAPVGLSYIGNPKYSFEDAAKIAAITHGHPSGYLSAGVFAAIISELAAGYDLYSSIQTSMEILKRWDNHEETLNAIEKALSLHSDIIDSDDNIEETLPEHIETLGGGWIGEEALSISLLCSLFYENDYKNGVLAAFTTAAIPIARVQSREIFWVL